MVTDTELGGRVFCTACGKPMSPESRFCTRCGRAITGPPSPPAAPPAPTAPLHTTAPGAGSSPPNTPRRGASPALKWVVAGAGVVGILVILGFVLFGLLGSSGADSPQAAVTGLVDAVSRQDPIRAISMLPPDELAGLSGTLKSLLGKLDGARLVSSSTPMEGITVRIDDAQTDVEQISDQAAMVHLRGHLTVHVDTASIPAPVRGALRLPDSGVHDLEYDLANDVPRYLDDGTADGLPLMTVKRGGGWYVSPMYTTAELIRLNYNESHSSPVSRPSFRDEEKSPTGADSPDGAVRSLLEANYSGDVDEMIDNLPPDELRVLRDYRDGLHRLDLTSSTVSSHITNLDTHSEEGPGGVTYVVVDKFASEGTNPAGTSDLTVTGNCVHMDVVSRSSYGDDDSDNRNGCLTDLLNSSEGSSAAEAREVLRDERVRFATVERDGRWYVSPMRTATGYVDRWLGMLDKDAIYRLLDVPQMGDPTGELAVGGATDVTLEEARPAVLGAKVDASGAFAASSGSRGASVSIFHDDGSAVSGAMWDIGDGTPVHLDAGGYKLVVRGSGPTHVSLAAVPSAPIAAPGTATVTTTGDSRSALVTGISSPSDGWFTMSVDGAVADVLVRDTGSQYSSTRFKSGGGIHLEPGHTYEAWLESEAPAPLQVTIAAATPGVLFANSDSQSGYVNTGGRAVHQVFLGKGQGVEIKAAAESSGSSSYSYSYTTLDPVLTITGPDGSTVATADDSSGSKDADARFTAPSTGVYTVQVGAYGSTSGRYRLSFSQS